MKNIIFKSKKSLLCLTFCGFLLSGIAVNAVDAKTAEEIKTVRTEQQSELDRIEVLLDNARKQTNAKNYPDAMGAYQEAVKSLQVLEGTKPEAVRKRLDGEFSRFRAEWADVIFNKARNAYQAGQFDDAINLASEVLMIDSRRSSDVQKFIEQCKMQKKAKGFSDNLENEIFSKEYQKKQENIDILYREAEIFFRNKRYSEARSKLEQIYIQDPFNTKANNLLERCYRQMYKYGVERHKADLEGLAAYSSWEWNQGVQQTSVDRSIKTAPEVKTQSTAEVHAKLESTIFPNIEFDEADINSVIRYLDRGAKRYDSSNEGISIIAGFDSTVASTLPKVTMSFSKIPLSEVLRYLTKSVGLKYKIEDNAIIIGVGVDDMQTEYFQIRGDLISDIAPAGEAAAGGAGEINTAAVVGGERTATNFEEFTATVGQERKISSESLIKYFELRGIKFDEGATIAYDTRSGRLIVKNTLENLRRMDELLRQLDLIRFPLVLIEAKIVELSQADVNELGFDWAFNVSNQDQNWSLNQGANPLRHFQELDFPNERGNASNSLVKDFKLFPNFGKNLIFGSDLNVSLSVNALSQNSRTETLSTPKVLTASGQRAVIEMKEQRTYAEDWDEPEVTVSGQNVTVTPPTPDWGEAIDIGIMLDVLPVISPDNYTVELHIISRVTSFVGEDIYKVPIEITYIRPGETKNENNEAEIKMPRIAVRSVDVNVKVYDGETIVLGGMIINRNVNRNDKWPIIGEIPILGRIFSSQLALEEKRNMLLFVTTRLVNNDGIPVRRDKQRALPDFYR